MNEVTIPIKLAGLGEMKAELKQIKNDLVSATDPAEIERLSSRAGELNQKLKDTSKTIKNFSTGSTVQQVGNQISGIKDSLIKMDFSKAATQVTAFTGTIAKFKVTDLTKGLGMLTSAVGKMGLQFLKTGAQLLVNPIFLLVVVIVAIVLAFTVWEDKLGKFGTVLKIAFFGIYLAVEAVKLLIAGFKELTDWLGFTSYAADENAERVTAAAEKANEASKRRSDGIGKSYDHEIAMAKIAGKDTVKLEIEKSVKLQKEAENRIKNNRKAYNSMKHMDDEEAIKKRTKLREDIKADNDLVKAGVNDRILIKAQSDKDEADADAAAARDKAAANAAAYQDRLNKQREAAQNRLDAERQIEDLRIAAIKDAGLREQATIAEKYKRLRADLLTDKTKNEAERIALQKAFNLAEKIEAAKTEEEKKKIANQNYQSLQALEISNMVEGEAKIAKQQQVALQLARNAAKAKYGADSEQYILFNEQLMIADAATTKARSDKKIADQQALLNSINELNLTDDQRKIAAIEAQYLKEQALANGNAETLLALKNKYDTDISNANITAANEEVENNRKVRDAKLTFAKDTVNGLTNLGGLLIKDQEKLAKFNKASALVQIGIDTAKAISALVAASNTNPLNGITAGGAGIAQFASGIIQIATNVAKAKQLLTAPSASVSGGGGSAGGGDTGGGSNTATMIPQAAQLLGSSNNANTMTAGGGSSDGGNMMVTAVVSETQITNVQKKINMINKNAEL